MRILIILFVALFVVACDTTSKWKPNQEVISKADSYSELSPYAKGVMRHRDSTSAMFLSGANGILPKEDLSPTGKLKYFAPDEAFRIKATFTPIENGEGIDCLSHTSPSPRDRQIYRMPSTA